MMTTQWRIADSRGIAREGMIADSQVATTESSSIV